MAPSASPRSASGGAAEAERGEAADEEKAGSGELSDLERVEAALGRVQYCGMPVGYLSLFALVLQSSTATLTLRFSRMTSGALYSPAVAVLLTETLKFAATLLILMHEQSGGSASRALGLLAPGKLLANVRFAVRTSLPVFLPALLYTVQQQLLIVAASGLDAVSFQVTNQLKVLPTALFATWLLGKVFTRQQWISLPLLALGVTVVNISSSSTGGGNESFESHEKASAKWFAGLAAAVVAGISSGYAGVYFERLVKLPGALASMWTMNAQMSVFALMISSINTLLVEQAHLQDGGLLEGFGGAAIATVCLQALGGIVVAVVVKYTDNIQKGFANAISIIVSWVISIPLFHLEVSALFALGLAIVVASLVLYSVPLEDLRRLRSRLVDSLRTRGVLSLLASILMLLMVVWALTFSLPENAGGLASAAALGNFTL